MAWDPWHAFRAARLAVLGGAATDMKVERRFFVEGDTLRIIDENGSRSFPLASVTSVRIICRTEMPWWLRPRGAYRRLWEGCLFRTQSGRFRLSSFDCPGPQVAELCDRIAAANPSLKVCCGAPYYWWLSLLSFVALGAVAFPFLLIVGTLHASFHDVLIGALALFWLLPVSWRWIGKIQPRSVDPRGVDVQFG
jgi:hypothetical protein